MTNLSPALNPSTVAGVAFPPPIFVLAPPGMQGETVAAVLARNPACFGLPECNLELAGNLDALMREMTGMRSAQLHGLMRGLSHLLGGEQSVAGVEMARRWLSRHLHLSTAAVWHLIAARVAPRRLVTPLTTTLFEPGSTGRLVTAFPQAHFVHLEMHPRSHGQAVMAQYDGTAAQILGAKDETVEPALADPQELWLMAEEGVEELAALIPPGQMHPLRLEDLAHDTARTIRALARELGLPQDRAALAAMAQPELSPFRGPGPFGAHLSGDILSLAELARTVPTVDGLSLTGWMPWRPDGMGLRAELRQRATAMGYA